MMCFKNTTYQNAAVLPVLFLVLLTAAAPSRACRVLPSEEAKASQHADIEEAKRATKVLQANADLVFVASMSKLTFQDIENADIAGSGRFRVYQVSFEDVENIKGIYSPKEPLNYAVNTGRVVVSCNSPKFTESRPAVNGLGERYLVYALAGELLRVNPVTQRYHALSADEEAKLVRGFQRQARYRLEATR